MQILQLQGVIECNCKLLICKRDFSLIRQLLDGISCQDSGQQKELSEISLNHETHNNNNSKLNPLNEEGLSLLS